jgi:membrane associated rhomboid family serine protease
VLFLPYKLDVSLYRLPFLTILVCLVCLATFLSQMRSGATFEGNLRNYCTQDLDTNLRAMLDNIDDRAIGTGCEEVFMAIRQSHDRDKTIAQLAHSVRNLDFYRDKAADLKYKQDTITSAYGDFEALVPNALTEKLAYRPDQYNVVTMITSTFAHASWDHLLGNLFFFFIFASCVECVLGPLHFSLSFIVVAVATSLAYSYSASATEGLPAVGLSGVAMGMMALLTTLLPRARIWCFFWFLFWVRWFTLPVLAIVAWQVGWNVYDLHHHDASSHINYMAHVSGAVTGFVLGMLYRMFAQQRLSEMTVEVGGG